jgi:glycosyltransferase involved in cell wall biosynthesis
VTVDVILPCLDEAEALPIVLAAMPAGFRALVVDNGSEDGSPDIALKFGAIIVPCEQKGYGAACHAGLVAATSDVVIVSDCDGSIDPAQYPDLVGPVQRGEADMTVGRRRHVARGAWPMHARLANVELARRLRRRTGVALRDLGPVRAMAREPFLALGIADRRSGYPVESVVRAADAGWRIVSVDVTYAPRLGRSKVTGTMRGSLQAVRDMSRELKREIPE